MERAYERSVGTALTAVGVVLLLVGFVVAFQSIQGLPSTQPPTARFQWTLNGTNASFTDRSTASGAAITTTYWSFGDGSSSSSSSPSHVYPGSGSYLVTLEIQDANGASARSVAQLLVGSGSASGSSGPSGSAGANGSSPLSSLGSALGSVPGAVKTVETFLLLLVVWLVGASILRAGWNLITPKAETISVRLRPRSLQVEAAAPPSPTPVVPPSPSSSADATPPGSPPSGAR